jgi:hypothetical protein
MVRLSATRLGLPSRAATLAEHVPMNSYDGILGRGFADRLCNVGYHVPLLLLHASGRTSRCYIG